MRIIRIFVTLAVIATVSVSSAFTNPDTGSKKRNKAHKTLAVGQGFAVVELFTSEGCSSCPPADEVIEKLVMEISAKPVYVLAYHVDYWNRLGWKDPFSSAEFSKRQSTYAAWLNLNSVYTPQVIVNGRTEFVGSQEGTLRNALAANLEKAPKVELSLSKIQIAGNKAKLGYSTQATVGQNALLVALIQKKATIEVKRGENRGRTLSHVQIVSDIKNIPLTAKTGETSIILPAKFSSKNFEVIAFLQDLKTGEVIAANKAEFPDNGL